MNSVRKSNCFDCPSQIFFKLHKYRYQKKRGQAGFKQAIFYGDAGDGPQIWRPRRPNLQPRGVRRRRRVLRPRPHRSFRSGSIAIGSRLPPRRTVGIGGYEDLCDQRSRDAGEVSQSCPEKDDLLMRPDHRPLMLRRFHITGEAVRRLSCYRALGSKSATQRPYQLGEMLLEEFLKPMEVNQRKSA